MADIEKILERHAKWHESLRRLSWAEKLRMAEAVMPTIRALRRQREERSLMTAGQERGGPPTNSAGCECSETQA